MKNTELMIALRYLRSRRKTKLISIITYLSIFGIAVGVAVLIIVTSVMNGFGVEVKERFISSDSHIKIYSYQERPFVVEDSLLSVLKTDKNVVAYSPYIEMFGLLKGDYSVGAMVRGIDLKTFTQISKLDSQIVAGKFSFETVEDDLPGIILGKGLADNLAAIVGEKIYIISSAIKNTFSAPPVKAFRVTGVFETGLTVIDGSLCYISTESAMSLFKMPGMVNKIGVKVGNPENAKKVSEEISDKISFPFLTRSWIDENVEFYVWMALEKLMMSFVLSLIVIIAAFNILSSLIMLVMEKRQEIGVLSALGYSSKRIMSIFMYQGVVLGIGGTILGTILGLTVCAVQKKYEIISLPDIYIINSLPIQVLVVDVVLIIISSLIISFLATLYPAFNASRLKPADVIRND
ncbi:MAG: ABC transporter permease [Candidatus Delongbacteria bacterium]|nr:ABC transporter permease [Candidatus Delongbacteria bacterium]MBN2836521.1 ABC transporter permease [Candidatus Delongbacteria bacterium]